MCIHSTVQGKEIELYKIHAVLCLLEKNVIQFMRICDTHVLDGHCGIKIVHAATPSTNMHD